MEIIPVLIAWPALAAVLMPLVSDRKARGVIAYVAAGGMMALALAVFGGWLAAGGQTVALYPQSTATEYVDLAMLCGEFVLMALIIALSIRHRK